MEVREFLYNLVAVCVLLSLIVAMVFATKGIRQKENKAARSAELRKAAIVFAVYAGLNVLRMLMEKGIL